jgi:hypothetical protein
MKKKNGAAQSPAPFVPLFPFVPFFFFIVIVMLQTIHSRGAAGLFGASQPCAPFTLSFRL